MLLEVTRGGNEKKTRENSKKCVLAPAAPGLADIRGQIHDLGAGGAERGAGGAGFGCWAPAALKWKPAAPGSVFRRGFSEFLPYKSLNLGFSRESFFSAVLEILGTILKHQITI